MFGKKKMQGFLPSCALIPFASIYPVVTEFVEFLTLSSSFDFFSVDVKWFKFSPCSNSLVRWAPKIRSSAIGNGHFNEALDTTKPQKKKKTFEDFSDSKVYVERVSTFQGSKKNASCRQSR